MSELRAAELLIFTALRKARFASAVYATVNPSIRLSVCLSHSGIVSKRGFLMPRMVDGGRPCSKNVEIIRYDTIQLLYRALKSRQVASLVYRTAP